VLCLTSGAEDRVYPAARSGLVIASFAENLFRGSALRLLLSPQQPQYTHRQQQASRAQHVLSIRTHSNL